MKIQRLFQQLPLLFFMLFVGCSTLSSQASIQGTVRYLERVALSPSAQLEIILADVSLADAPYQIIHQIKIAPAGQVPISFVMEYDAQKIIPSHTYAVMARITDGGHLLFINDRSYQVITRDQPTKVDMILKRVIH